MTLKDFLETNEPQADKIITFFKKYSGLFLPAWTIATPLLGTVLNSLNHIYKLGFFYLGFHVPTEFLGPMQTSGIPFSFVGGAVLAALLILYFSAAITSYRKSKVLRFLADTLVCVGIFWSVLLAFPFLFTVSTQGLSCDLISTIFWGIIHLTFLTLIPLYLLVSICPFVATYKVQLDRQINIILIKERRQEQCKDVKFAKKLLLEIWMEQESLHRRKKADLEFKIECKQKREDAEPKTIRIKRSITSTIVYSFSLPILLGLFGLLSAYQTTNFRLIDTDQDIFSQQIIAELNTDNDEAADNDKVNGLVELFRNEEHIVIAPCVYSENKDKITIYTAYQHVIPTENSTYVRKSFQRLDIK